MTCFSLSFILLLFPVRASCSLSFFFAVLISVLLESAVIHGKHAASTPLVFDQEVAVVGNKLVHLSSQEQPQAKVCASMSLSRKIGHNHGKSSFS